MRLSPQRVSFSVMRSFDSTIAVPRPIRSLHWTTPACMPRRRNFFTSNPLLVQNSNDEGNKGESKPSSQAQPSSAPSASSSSSPSNAKRKPSRATATQSLRRLAIIAQQPKKSPDGKSVSGSEGGNLSNLISATCIAEAFDMPMVLDILTSHGLEIDPDGAGFESNEVLHARGVNGGDIFIFPSGTVVTWALPADVVTRQILRAAEDPHPGGLREVEDLQFITDTTRETSTLKGDLVVLGTRKEHKEGDTQDTTLAKIAFSSGLARSTKLAVLETALTSYFESTRNIPALLSKGTGVPLRRSFILKKTGELLSLRARLNHYSELTDSLPDIFWDSRHELNLEGYYETVGRALDVNIRIKTLNQKMDYAQEIATVLRELSSEQHGTRLEWIIILLIAVEVVFEMRRIYLEWARERELALEAEKGLR